MTSLPAPGAWIAGSEEADVAGDPGLAARVDVGIVGGGYTGLSTALHCAQAGLSVQVIEAGAIGTGGSGRNVGLVNAGLWLPPAQVTKVLGEAVAGPFLRRFGAAPAQVFDLIERHQIRCAATRTGTIHAAHSRAGLRDLQGRHRAWQAAGAPVTLLDGDAVAERTGSRAFFGGLVDARAGTVNPMAYARGLARVARAAGSRIATQTPVTGLRPHQGGWQIVTEAGTVTARTAVLATNAYTGALWPALSRSLTPLHYVQIATEPLGTRSAGILKAGEGLWDTAPIMSSLRRDRDGRLIVGSMGRLIGSAESGVTRRWAAALLRKRFPDLGPVRFESAWDGVIGLTSEHIPRIYRLADGLYAPSAYNGRGITTGTVFGQALADHLTGAPDALPLPPVAPSPDRAAPLRAGLYDMAFAANQVLRGLA